MGKTNIARVRETQDDIKRGAPKDTDLPTIKWEEGSYRLRILPPPGDSEEPWRKVQTCFSVGPNKKTLIPRKQYGLEPCPLSEYLSKLAKKSDAVSQKTYKSQKPSTRFKMFVIDRNDEAPGPKLMDLNVVAMKDLLLFFADEEYGDLSDPEDGRDLKITYIPKEKSNDGFPKIEIIPSAKITPLRTKGVDDETYRSWLSEDYFTKYRIGFPSDPDYVKAVLDGQEASFKGSRVTQQDGTKIQWREDGAPGATAASDEDDEDAPPPARKPPVKAAVDDEDEPENVQADSQEDVEPSHDSADDTTADPEAEAEAVRAATEKAKARKGEAKPSTSVIDAIKNKIKNANK